MSEQSDWDPTTVHLATGDDRSLRFYASMERGVFRTSGLAGDADMLEVERSRFSDPNRKPSWSISLDSDNAPDLGLRISHEQAAALGRWLVEATR